MHQPTQHEEIVGYADGEPIYADPLIDHFHRENHEQKVVYFIQAAHGGPIKIGYSTNLESRLHDLQKASPYRLVVRRVFPGGTPRREAELHKRFAGARLSGEWFAATPELAAFAHGLADTGVPIYF